MRYVRHTMTIKVQTNSIDSMPAIINEMAALIRGETVEGKLQKDDGDLIEWETDIKQIKVIEKNELENNNE